MPNGPLSGIKVLDLTRILAGPWASQLLADYGADVIKVERPGVGDDTRRWGPPWFKASDSDAVTDAAYFLAANRNKRSITVDFTHPEGRKVVTALAAQSDVLIENFKVGDLARYKLDAETMRATNPWLIYCSISAYGQTGSRASQPGYDAMIQASAGLMSITGEPEEAGGQPQKVGVAISDIMSGMYATTAVLAALHERGVSGTGQHIDVALYDSQVAWLANQSMNYLVGGDVPGRLGTAHPNIVPYQVFRTSDSYLMLAVGNDRQFRACVDCLGVGGLADDTRFATNGARIEHREELVATLSKAFLKGDTAFWLERLAECNVPAGPVNSLDTVLGDDYAAERELVQKITRSDQAEIPTVANPVRFSRSTIAYERAPPRLGEHTEEILSGELGYGPELIEKLHEDGVV